MFSGLDRGAARYDPTRWSYEGADGAAPASRYATVLRTEHDRSAVTRRPTARRRAAGSADVTRRCSIRAACSRSSSATSPGTRQRWSSRSAACRRRCSSGSASCSRRTPAATGPPRSCTASAGPSTPSACSTSATAAILQLLLGNIGRPGGGILALRGHASIQGSTDIPTLFDLLPGYLPMPHAARHRGPGRLRRRRAHATRASGPTCAPTWSACSRRGGATAATAENDFCFDYLPRLTGDHSTYETVMAQLDGTCKGYFLLGENPAVGSANAQHAAARHGQPGLAGRARLRR